MVTNKKIIEQIEKLAKNEGYEKIILNISEKSPMTIEGIKGRFVPEVLCYAKGKIKALVTFIKSLDDIEEFYKLTLFMDYANKNNLYLYIVYDKRKFSQEEFIQKLMERGIEIFKNTKVMGICL
ncbi:MAG: hypothetical protein AB1567_10925 [bacterium]